MRKIYVIDTSVLIHDPNSYLCFTGNDVIIPINVLDELDKLKNLPNEVGKNARTVIRALDKISQTGDISQGVGLNNNILLRINTESNYLSVGQDQSYVDNKILSCALKLKLHYDKRKVILVSKDINLRVRAKAFKIKAEDYTKDKINVDNLYFGHKVIKNEELGNLLTEYNILDNSKGAYPEVNALLPNECVYFTSDEGKGLALGRKIGNTIKKVESVKPWGLSPRNKEQAFAVDMILDPNISLVSLIGLAGCGKTLLAIASALEAVLEQKQYKKLLIYRPIQPVGKDLGFLPGDINDKLRPWIQPIVDSLEFLFDKGDHWQKKLDLYIEKGIISYEAIAYIRGRSIPNALMLIDEAQNLSSQELKTILTRVSSGTKIILTGDVNQIDNSSLDSESNGLSYVLEKFKDSPLAGHITMISGERSPLATVAAKIL